MSLKSDATGKPVNAIVKSENPGRPGANSSAALSSECRLLTKTRPSLQSLKGHLNTLPLTEKNGQTMNGENSQSDITRIIQRQDLMIATMCKDLEAMRNDVTALFSTVASLEARQDQRPDLDASSAKEIELLAENISKVSSRMGEIDSLKLGLQMIQSNVKRLERERHLSTMTSADVPPSPRQQSVSLETPHSYGFTSVKRPEDGRNSPRMQGRGYPMSVPRMSLTNRASHLADEQRQRPLKRTLSDSQSSAAHNTMKTPMQMTKPINGRRDMHPHARQAEGPLRGLESTPQDVRKFEIDMPPPKLTTPRSFNFEAKSSAAPIYPFSNTERANSPIKHSKTVSTARKPGRGIKPPEDEDYQPESEHASNASDIPPRSPTSHRNRGALNLVAAGTATTPRHSLEDHSAAASGKESQPPVLRSGKRRRRTKESKDDA